ncbi:CobW family GTP-binding protein [Marinibactrum halimedae]|uniref:CobW/HypB/UreG nucleotide-binding domain-containing protein n=1 Tax=Marinibactrum halimedae TaxID=1444977 RepID=A0AA37WNH5_9GAMM|nr:GTP-binding protein [Marinibactrum halimedae]MCD9458169.1 GTP-binding protein [Marinibactrum halimedae]GLS25102.1 hypothetical protein GCM10007877_08160 [Marinibactrum halimedae]
MTSSAVPAIIITGFLGTGKTTAIQHLMKQKPSHERWAILINEFGQIGMDEQLLSPGVSQKSGIFTKEVPGGCMCCTSGLPMQIALNMLIAKSKPHRLIIEPTGLGHPKEVIETLSSEYYQEVIKLALVATLVDPRHFHQDKYLSHETFRQQLSIADVIIANKSDLCEESDHIALRQFLDHEIHQDLPVICSEQGQISLEDVKLYARAKVEPPIQPLNIDEPKPTLISTPVTSRVLKNNRLSPIPAEANRNLQEPTNWPEEGYIFAKNTAENYFSYGYRYPYECLFNQKVLQDFFDAIQAIRVKAIIRTEQGFIQINRAYDTLSTHKTTPLKESRLEFITEQPIASELLNLLQEAVTS